MRGVSSLLVGGALLVALVFVLSGCTPDAFAKSPNVLSDPVQWARVGAPVWGHSHTVPTGAVAGGFVSEAGGVSAAVADLHLFEFGTLIVASCTLASTFCFVQDFDETTIAITGVVTDTDAGAGGGNDGVGSCFRVEAGLARDVTVWRDNFRASNKVGRRQGYCTINTTTLDWPCDADADCSTSGVCVRTNTGFGHQGTQSPVDKIRGAFLVSRAGAESNCFITEER